MKKPLQIVEEKHIEYYNKPYQSVYYNTFHEVDWFFQIIYDKNMNIDEKTTIKRFKAELKKIVNDSDKFFKFAEKFIESKKKENK